MATITQVSLSWGKPKIKIDNEELWTPVEDSTELTPTQGDKIEAKIEGGEVEAVRYKAPTHQVKFKLRRAKGRPFPKPINNNGMVEGEHSLTVIPEDATTPGFTMPRGVWTVLETFTAADGAILDVTVDGLAPTDGGKTVQWTDDTSTPSTPSN